MILWNVISAVRLLSQRWISSYRIEEQVKLHEEKIKNKTRGKNMHSSTVISAVAMCTHVNRNKQDT
jgi:hypothetical protein